LTLGCVFALSFFYLPRRPAPIVQLPTVYHFPANTFLSHSQTPGSNTPPILVNPPRPPPPIPSTSPTQPYTKSLVIARTKSEDLSWLNEQIDGTPITTNRSLHIYTTDDLSSAHHTPLNKGREAMAYLTYLIEHYASLPQIILFMHPHRTSWHDNFFSLSSPQTLSSLRLDRVRRLGYMNLRCTWEPGCPEHIHPEQNEQVDVNKPEEAVFAAAWAELFPADRRVPDVLSQACCAQVAVVRERVWRHAKSRYVG
jgi:hypothetical protein